MKNTKCGLLKIAVIYCHICIRNYTTEAVYEGNAIDPSVLEQAGIREAQALAAVTTDDSINLVLCFLAKTMFSVPRTIARVNNPNNAWLFNDKFHVDIALNQADVLAHLIQEEMSLGDMMTLFKIRPRALFSCGRKSACRSKGDRYSA